MHCSKHSSAPSSLRGVDGHADGHRTARSHGLLPPSRRNSSASSAISTSHSRRAMTCTNTDSSMTRAARQALRLSFGRHSRLARVTPVTIDSLTPHIAARSDARAVSIPLSLFASANRFSIAYSVTTPLLYRFPRTCSRYRREKGVARHRSRGGELVLQIDFPPESKFIFTVKRDVK